MKSYDVRLISASYTRETADTVVVDLFGKTIDGTSIIARRPFKPWFQIIEPSPGCLAALRKDPEVVSIEDCKLWHEGEYKTALHITAKHPWKVGGPKGMRKQYESEYDADAFACDIPFHLRFIYDFDLSACIRVTGDIETDAEIKKKFSADLSPP